VHWKCAAHWGFPPSVNLNGHDAHRECGALGSWRGAHSSEPEIVSNLFKLLIPCVELSGRAFYFDIASDFMIRDGGVRVIKVETTIQTLFL